MDQEELLQEATSLPGAYAVRGLNFSSDDTVTVMDNLRESSSRSLIQRQSSSNPYVSNHQTSSSSSSSSSLLGGGPISATVVPPTPISARASYGNTIAPITIQTLSNNDNDGSNGSNESQQFDENNGTHGRKVFPLKEEEDDEDEIEDSDDEKGDFRDSTSAKRLKVMAIAMVAIASCCVIGLLLYFIFPTGDGNKNNTTDNITNNGNKSSPDSEQEEEFFSFTPLETDIYDIWKVIFEKSLQLVEYQNDDGKLRLNQIFNDISSPQYQAYQWIVSSMINETMTTTTPTSQVSSSSLKSPLSEIQILERYTLVTFFYSTGGNDNNWVEVQNFLNPDISLCHWFVPRSYYGMCDDTKDHGRIKYIKFTYNGLSGTIPHELGLLSLLEDISLQNNQLYGTIPSSLVHLTNLKYIRLSNNLLHSTLPSSLGQLSNLFEFSVPYNELSGTIPQFYATGWESIGIIRLQDNDFVGSISLEFCSLIEKRLQEFPSLTLAASCQQLTCSCCVRCCDDINVQCSKN